MNAIVRIDDHEFTPALLTGEDIRSMTQSGVLPEGRGFELIDGVLVSMAAQLGPHVRMVHGLMRKLILAMPEEWAVSPAPSLFLSDTTMLEPDICIFPASMEGPDVRGPDLDLVIEVSDTTLRNDLGKKAKLYAAYGVRHYWVVDVTGQQLHRHTQPEETGYASIITSGPGDAVPLPVTGEVLHIFG